MAESGLKPALLPLHSPLSESVCDDPGGNIVTSYSEGSEFTVVCVKTEPDDEDVSHNPCSEVQSFDFGELDSGAYLTTAQMKTESDVMGYVKEEPAHLQLCSSDKVPCLCSEELPSAPCLSSKHCKLEMHEVDIQKQFQLPENPLNLKNNIIATGDDLKVKGAFEKNLESVTNGMLPKASNLLSFDGFTRTDKKWRCLQCGKVLKTRSYLKTHLQLHSVERSARNKGGGNAWDATCSKANRVNLTPKEDKLLKKVQKRSRVQIVKRKALSLNVKLEVLKRIERGERNRDICIAMGLASSTVRTIFQNKEKIEKTASSVVGGTKLTNTRSRHAIMEKLEHLLLLWIDSETQRSVPLSYLLIQQKALSLFEGLRKVALEKGDETVRDLEFKASHGWFERFIKRGRLHNLKLSGEATCADSEFTSTFPSELQEMIVEGGYSLKQVFNMDETGLFWKRMPSRSYIAMEERVVPGHKPSKDRLMLLLGGNLEGDVKLKPLLVYHSENPRALKRVLKSSLPVFWRWNRKAWVTCELFIEYIKSYFVPFVTQYCKENNLDNKALLVIDNAPGHPSSIFEYGDNIQVVFLPPTTTSLLQPMDQGVIATFKAYYLQLVMKYLVEGAKEKSLKDVWREYNIKKAIEFIAQAWDKVTPHTMNGVWKRLCPRYVCNFQGFEDNVREVKECIVKYAEEAGFVGVDAEDVQQVLESHSETLTIEELLELESHLAEEREEEDTVSSKGMNVQDFKELFRLQKRMFALLEKDADVMRSMSAKNVINEGLDVYKNLYETNFKKVKKNSVKPQKQDNKRENEPSALTSRNVVVRMVVPYYDPNEEEEAIAFGQSPDIDDSDELCSFYASLPHSVN